MPPKPMKVVNRPPASAGNGKPDPGADVLDRIVPVESRLTGIKLLTYGRGKTGKTRLMCSFPKPLLVIGTEDGTKSVAGIPGLDFVRITTGDEFTRLVRYVAEGGKSRQRKVGNTWERLPTRTGERYASVGLDQGGGFQDIILKDVLGLDKIPLSKYRQAGKGETWGITDQGTWGTIGTQFKERIVELLDLSDTIDLNVIVIAHERNFKESGDTGDALTPTVGAALTPSAASFLNGAVDYICQTYIREQEVEIDAGSEIEGAEGVKVLQKTGKKEFCLRVGPHHIFMTGFRQEWGAGPLPDTIVNPSYEKIVSLIRGKK